MSGSDDLTLRQLRWRCRRGMRELDQILERFLERGFAELSAAEKLSFREFLGLPDPDIHAYLVGRAEPRDLELAKLLRRIRECVLD